MREKGFRVEKVDRLRNRGDRWILDKRQGSSKPLGEFHIYARENEDSLVTPTGEEAEELNGTLYALAMDAIKDCISIYLALPTKQRILTRFQLNT